MILLIKANYCETVNFYLRNKQIDYLYKIVIDKYNYFFYNVYGSFCFKRILVKMQLWRIIMYNIIVNPTGGKGKSLKTLSKVEEILKNKGCEYKVYKTDYKGHATEIVKELSRIPDTKLIVLGGDGSFNEILNGIECFENVTLGLVPCGTGNDFVSAFKHPKKVKDAMDIILNGNAAFVDYIQLEDRRCLNVLGGGMDVDVLLKYAEMKHFHGKMKYYASLLYTLAHTKWHQLRLTLDDGESMDRSVFMIGVGNGRSIGGGMPICPNAVVDDGKLSIVVVNQLKKSRIPTALISFLSGKHVKKDFVEEFTAKKVRIDILDDSKFEADGEVFGAEKIECEVVSNKLKIYR